MSSAAGSVSEAGCRVHIESKTWVHERGDLFDFEADPEKENSKIMRQDFVLSDSAMCVRNGAGVQLLQQDQAGLLGDSAGSELLVRLVCRDNALWIDRDMDAVGVPKPSLVVKDLPGGSHCLRGGETIRLGAARIRVRQVVAAGHPAMRPRLKLDTRVAPCIVSPGQPEELAGTTCRICLDGPNGDDPLISPCACKGSVEHVHLSCLREWIRVRCGLPSSDELCTGFQYRPLDCDLCKKPYAPTVCSVTEGVVKAENLVEIPRVQPPFVVMDVSGHHYGGGGRRTYVLSLAGEENGIVKLGRTHNCHMQIPDATVSRWHASLRVHMGKVLLEDHGSKYGTLLEVERPVPVNANRSISLQVGRTLLRLSGAAAS